MRGDLPVPARVGWGEIGWSWLGSFLGILIVAVLDRLFLQETDQILLLGSFGASAVLIFGAPASPLAQPRNLVLGHFISALIGVASVKLLPGAAWLAAPVAVSLAIAAMHLTRTLHPPGGATALIAVIGSEQIHALGFFYAFLPVLAGVTLLLGTALLFNNLISTRRYPLWW
ncbi:MAG: HPP family protein [Magnetococcales bacterium]|nr:HPP family protein [Magnetococcales bacterium]